MTQAVQVIKAQREAANPQHSVWVTANAGTGKTKVLTDRVLRLLLQGTQPEKILCLTYTRAAAAEMLARLQQVLGKWVALSDTELDEQLKSLTGQMPDAPLRRRARDLFLSVMEAPEGVRIMTLHSLCQSLLKRFSLEAKVSPYFRLMDEAQISILLTQAKHDLLTTPRLPKEIIDLQPSLRRIAEQLSEDRLDKLMEEIINHRQQLERWFAQSDLNVRQRVTETLGVDRAITQEQLYADFARDLLPRLPQLQEAARILSTSSSKDQRLGNRLADALSYWRHYPERLGTEAPPQEYYQAFFTQKHTPTKNIPTKNIADNHPAVFDFLQTEQQIAIRFYQRLWQRQAADWSLAVLSLAEALLALYDKQKHQQRLGQ